MSTLRHIFCIDDEEDILEIAKLCLEMVAGFQVTCCNNAAHAIEKIRQAKPDLILLDMMMPGMDGATALGVLRNDPELSHIPVIFMTARVQQSEISEYIDKGAAGVLPKPFDPMKLSEQITTIWDNL